MERRGADKRLTIKIIAAAVLALALLFSGSTLLQPPERISTEAFRQAFAALHRYRGMHPDENPRILAVVDYSKPSYVERMALIDLQSGYRTFYRVSHGRKTGMLYPVAFSNIPQSNMSSLGLYKVLETYYGDHGKAMRLEGLEPAVNDSAYVRDIVLHSAKYISPAYILLNLVTLNGPMTGRSNGCFVVSLSEIDEVTAKFAAGAFIFAWADTAAIRANR
ncbi:MAG: murein L,D-transpeptidase catalytic domain family protein [Chlorobiaceae bacterium]|nr:murein L,D-transpeptidase catalytic domain family protein [Chlorobiaceae bacterium]